MKYMLNFNEAFVDSNGNISHIDANVFDEFPEDILKILDDNYSYLLRNFDWNSKSNEFTKDGKYDGNGFSKWIETHKQTEFTKNLSKIISAIRSDILLLRRLEMSKRKLEAFEELIKPVFGNHITGDALTKFEEEILLNPYASIEQLEKGFQDAKNLIDEYGNIDASKMEKSTVFVGGEVNLPKFEEFVRKNPQYKKTFDIWVKLFDEETELMLKDTNASHSISVSELRKLYDFLMEYRKKQKISK